MNKNYFDTLTFKTKNTAKIREISDKHQINFHYSGDGAVTIALDETTTKNDVLDILNVFTSSAGSDTSFATFDNEATLENIPASLTRTTEFLLHPVFNSHHSETELMRYLKVLENKDLSLTTSMIALGSCTMKLNAATELIPVSWSHFSRIHPFAPLGQTKGYQYIISDLEKLLCAIT